VSDRNIREWTLSDEIGRGAIGVIYRATHKYLKGEYAVKALRSSMVANDGARARFLREAETAARLRHPNVVETLPAFEAGGRLYLPMEMLRGNSLLTLLDASGEPWDFARVRFCAAQAAAGLGYAHGKDVLHRDVKPSNMMILDDGRTVKVLDFGLAKSMDAKKLTATGAAVGTPLYMAPELLDGDPATKQSDVYALGMVLFRLVTGRLPFDTLPNENIWKLVSALRLAQMNGFSRTTEHRADVPPDLDTLIARMLSSEPSQRPIDAQEVANLLAPALSAPCVIAPAAGLLDETSAGAPTSEPGAFPAATEHQRPPEGTPSTIETPVAGPHPDASGAADTVPSLAPVVPGPDPDPTFQSIEPQAKRRKSGVAGTLVVAGALVLAGFALSLTMRDQDLPEDVVADVIPAATWVAISAGEYTIGSDSGAMNEAPPHSVTLSAFLLTEREITVAEFAACVASKRCVRKNYLTATDDRACNFGAGDREDHPMNCVAWHGADEMCRAMYGATLPTEAQWEAAARGREGRPFPWGDQPAKCDRAVMDDSVPGCGIEHTAAGGSTGSGATQEGLHDLAGNVAEWVADNFAASYEQCGASCTGQDPSGPPRGSHRVVRGGSWADRADALRATARRGAYPDLKAPTNGFRCARPAP